MYSTSPNMGMRASCLCGAAEAQQFQATGASVGAAIGSIIPGLGTITGTYVGTVLGTIVGLLSGALGLDLNASELTMKFIPQLEESYKKMNGVQMPKQLWQYFKAYMNDRTFAGGNFNVDTAKIDFQSFLNIMSGKDVIDGRYALSDASTGRYKWITGEYPAELNLPKLYNVNDFTNYILSWRAKMKVLFGIPFNVTIGKPLTGEDVIAISNKISIALKIKEEFRSKYSDILIECLFTSGVLADSWYDAKAIEYQGNYEKYVQLSFLKKFDLYLRKYWCQNVAHINCKGSRIKSIEGWADVSPAANVNIQFEKFSNKAQEEAFLNWQKSNVIMSTPGTAVYGQSGIIQQQHQYQKPSEAISALPLIAGIGILLAIL
jgi:hypothetical protein